MKIRSVFLSMVLLPLGLLALYDTASAQTAAQDCYRLSGDQKIAACDRAIKQNPRDAKAFVNRGIAWGRKGDNDRAIADFNVAIGLNPQDADAFYSRGIAWSAKGDNDRAIADYNEAIRLNPKDAAAFNNRGKAWYAKSDNDRAIADFNVAIRLNPQNANHFVVRGVVWRIKGDHDRAISDFNEAIRLNPQNAIAFINRGVAWLDKGDNDRAIADYNEVIRLYPQDAHAFYFRGIAWGRKGDNDRAITDFNEVIRLYPQDAAAFGSRGNAWNAKGDKDRAIADYNEAIRLDPTDAQVFYKRGNAWESKREFVKALSDFRTFVSLAPNDPNGPKAVARVLAATGSQPQVAPQGRRVALLIGNSEYQRAGVLKNPRNDVALLASTFRSSGFHSVTVKTDMNQQQTLQALREFSVVADGADWAVVYYSGHGIELGGVNYIVPIEAQLKSDRDVDLEAVDIGKVISSIGGAKRLRIIILDACRDNPLAGQMRRTMVSRSIGRGLARMEPEAGTLVAYAAKHGELALDGDGENSPYAQALAKRIRQTPALEVRRLFDVVRDDVMEATGQKQQPFSYGSVSGSIDFYFAQN